MEALSTKVFAFRLVISSLIFWFRNYVVVIDIIWTELIFLRIFRRLNFAIILIHLIDLDLNFRIIIFHRILQFLGFVDTFIGILGFVQILIVNEKLGFLRHHGVTWNNSFWPNQFLRTVPNRQRNLRFLDFLVIVKIYNNHSWQLFYLLLFDSFTELFGSLYQYFTLLWFITDCLIWTLTFSGFSTLDYLIMFGLFLVV